MISPSFSHTAITVANQHAFAHIAAKKSPLVNLASGKWVPVKFAISLGARIVVHKGGVTMPKPYHIIATEDGNGYNITIPENPNVTAHCTNAADIMTTAAAAREKDEQNRHEKAAVCPVCGKEYKGYPAISRTDNKTEICPDCGTRQALAAVGMEQSEQDKIIAEIHKATSAQN